MVEIALEPDGDLVIAEMPLILADTLQRIPELLRSEDAEVRGQLLPRTYADDDDEAHWRRYVGPDLEHLFASRAEIVQKDLRALEVESDGVTFRITIPLRHRAAWQAALMGAAHALRAAHALTADEVAAELGALGDPARDVALLRVQLLTMLVGGILECEGHHFPSSAEIDGWEAGPG